MSDKKFFGNAKAIGTKYGQIVKLGFTVTDLQEMLALAQSNARGWTNLALKTGKEGNMYMELDTYDGGQPQAQQQQWGGQQAQQQPQTQPQQAWGQQQQQQPPQQWGQPQTKTWGQ